MLRIFILFCIILWGSLSMAAEVTLTWDQNTEHFLGGYVLWYDVESHCVNSEINCNSSNVIDEVVYDGEGSPIVIYIEGKEPDGFSEYPYILKGDLISNPEFTLTVFGVVFFAVTAFSDDYDEIDWNTNPPIATGKNTVPTQVEVETICNLAILNIFDNTVNAKFIGLQSYYSNQISGDFGSTSVDTDGDGIVDSEDTDDDNDGMPDIWEVQFDGLNPLVNDSDLDLDLDTITNLEEYTLDTNPIENEITDLLIPTSLYIN